jgi:hypothetical protein
MLEASVAVLCDQRLQRCIRVHFSPVCQRNVLGSLDKLRERRAAVCFLSLVTPDRRRSCSYRCYQKATTLLELRKPLFPKWMLT